MKKLCNDLWLLKGGSPKDQEAQILLKDVTNMAVVEDSQSTLPTHTATGISNATHHWASFWGGAFALV